MFDEPWRPKETLFPGLEWEHRDRYSVAHFMGKEWWVDASHAMHSKGFKRHEMGADPLPWLRSECLKHLQACARTMGMRVVTGEQLVELVEAALEAERVNSWGTSRRIAEATRELEEAWEDVGGRPK